MSEIKRIQDLHLFPDSFWEEEIKSDFTVSKERKQLWAVLLDLYREFAHICEKHNLRFFAIGGTLLGAARHEGFIPWDDDMDIAMPRKDYDKLKKLASEFKHPYFLQTPETDGEYGYSFMKIRNSNTTCEIQKFKHNKFNHGMFIDIFPIDKVNKEDFHSKRTQISELMLTNVAHMKRHTINPTSKDIETVKKYYRKDLSVVEVYRELENLAKESEDSRSKYCSLLIITIIAENKALWPLSAFDEYDIFPFENFKIRVPKGWKEILEIQFGDWKKFPPIEQRGAWHDFKFIDIPYKEYLDI